MKQADIAALKSLVHAVAVYADNGEFDALEQLFAQEILVDYSSLSGAEAEVKSPEALMTQWASLLPGFEQTLHQIGTIEVSVEGDRASAHAKVVADHYVNQLHWQVSGSYDYQFIRQQQDWLISAIQFNLVDERGTRDVFAPAAANAKAQPVAYLQRQQSQAAVKAFLRSLESKDMSSFAELWAEDVVQDMPFSPEGHPKRVVGKANILELYANWPNVARDADFTSNLVFYPTQDPQTLFVEFTGDVQVIPTGRHYQQTYAALFHVENQKITLFREYYNPAPFSWAFALNE